MFDDIVKQQPRRKALGPITNWAFRLKFCSHCTERTQCKQGPQVDTCMMELKTNGYSKTKKRVMTK